MLVPACTPHTGEPSVPLTLDTQKSIPPALVVNTLPDVEPTEYTSPLLSTTTACWKSSTFDPICTPQPEKLGADEGALVGKEDGLGDGTRVSVLLVNEASEG